MAYVVPIHHASSIRHALKLQFLNPGEDCLVVAKSNRLEFYSQTPEGLSLQYSKAIYGKVTTLAKLSRPPIQQQQPQTLSPPQIQQPLFLPQTDVLFIGTDRATYFTVSWNPVTSQLRTERKYVDLADPSSRESQLGDRCLIDPSGKFITLELYEGIITVIPIGQPQRTARQGGRKYGKRAVTAQNQHDSSHIGNTNAAGEVELGEPCQARVDELLVRSSAFLHTQADMLPRMAFLYEDTMGQVRLKVRELEFTYGGMGIGTGGGAGQDTGCIAVLKALDLLKEELEMGASFLIPVPAPLGGLLVLGETSIRYLDDATNECISLPLDEATIFVAWEQVDGQRWLLADDYGRLFFLMLILDEDNAVQSWKLDLLGNIPRASVLVYLGGGVTFIGSHQGDSQLIRITEGSFEVIQTFSNIAPILDFTIMDLGGRAGENQTHDFSSGQARIVTGSGAFDDGSLRSVRSGVGMEEVGVLGAMEHITDLWALRVACQEGFSDTLLVSFVDESRVFHFTQDGEVEEKDEFMGLGLAESTLLAANLPNGRILQVTERNVRVADLDDGMLLWNWSPPSQKAITAASSNDDHLVLVVGGQVLMCFDIQGEIKLAGKKDFGDDTQVSGVTVASSPATYCILCLPQTAEVAVMSLADMTIRHSTSVGEPGEAFPRSVLVAEVLPNQPATLFVSMADGGVFSFSFNADEFTLTKMSKLVLGSEQPSFKKLPRGDGLYNIFATCEQPSLIYATEGRIIYSAVHSDQASRICHFNSEAYPGSIALATPTELKIAHVDSERTTQIHTLEIGETVRRVAYSAAEKAFGIGTIKRTLENGAEVITSRFMLADEIMFRELDDYSLRPDELVESVIQAQFPEGKDSDGNESFKDMFVVGTSYLDDVGEGSIRGRILAFEVTGSRQLAKVAELPVKGACRALAVMQDKIVAALMKTVVIYSIAKGELSDYTLNKTASYRTSTAPIDIAVTGNLIAVADLMKSVSIIEFKQGENDQPDSLTEVARHFQTLWSTAVAPIAENMFLESDAEGNLVVLNQNVNGVTDDDKRRLEVTSEILLGEMVNRIRPVSIQGSLPATGPREAVISPKAFLGTVEGSIYLFGLINPAYQDLLMRLQSAMAGLVVTPGAMPFNKFRAFKNAVRQAEEPYRFVDGELIERFWTCEAALQEEIVGLVVAGGVAGVTVEKTKRIVEELRRMH
ncbi:DNA damage-binding protein 1a [Paracoccidioides lutzii Pb01]|uniref:DNA damage-binding protein 1 n=1 Tax=Paracoccidioides lutzii (strain ATCC MYA-826 / Pb01) TaxID=502779 RepID=C1GZN5_PARBA|nr:DNA damage-binding protein 1a [Paracoccidioides lutzii Pb01]EEH42058.1 DNA damage-binding protein 1a [Paracoccidioides lutzii Pb01]